MQFINRKHQCHVVGEGSFVGNAGKLSTLQEDEEDDSGVLGTMKKSRSVFSLTSSTEFEVTVDVEPIIDTHSSLESTRMSSIPDRGKQCELIPSFDDTSSAMYPPKSMKGPVGDEVISEDGMLQTSK